jgi:hypothetical protein
VEATSPRYCSLGDSRSWTDVVTNVTELSAARVSEDFDALMGWGSFPEDLLPGFVHELTHHWCFLSPVGFALSMLQLRAHRSGVLLYNGVGDERALRKRLIDDLLRCETAAIMLRPLAEGLALFAEFDAVSSKQSSVRSLPSELAGTFFGLWSSQVPGTNIFFPYMADQKPLADMRRGYHCFRRKRSLLQQPFDLSAGGYLPGYLTVRTIWRELAKEDQRLFNETDLALMYIRSFFYADDELVNLLLRPRDDLDANFEIVRHIAERVDQIAAVGAPEIAAFEKAIENLGSTEPNSSHAPVVAAALLVSPDAHEESHHYLKEVEAAFQETDLDRLKGVDDALELWDRLVLGGRDTMYLGSLSCLVDVGVDGSCSISADGMTRKIAALEGIEAGQGPGSIDILFSTMTAHKARAAVVNRGDDRVAVVYGGPDSLTEEARARFDATITSRAALQSGTSEMRDNMESAIGRDPTIAGLRDDARELAEHAGMAIYSNMATLDLEDNLKEQALARMSQDGFLEILDWNGDLVDGLALVSLGWSLRLRRDGVKELLAERGIELDDFLKSLDRCSKLYGQALVLDGGEILLAAA